MEQTIDILEITRQEIEKKLQKFNVIVEDFTLNNNYKYNIHYISKDGRLYNDVIEITTKNKDGENKLIEFFFDLENVKNLGAGDQKSILFIKNILYRMFH